MAWEGKTLAKFASKDPAQRQSQGQELTHNGEDTVGWAWAPGWAPACARYAEDAGALGQPGWKLAPRVRRNNGTEALSD